MSFEGYYQCWCINGHFWYGCYDYGTGGLEESDHYCPNCGKTVLFSNRVDQTNGGEDYKIETKLIKVDENGHETFKLPTIYYKGCDSKDGLPEYIYIAETHEFSVDPPTDYPNIKQYWEIGWQKFEGYRDKSFYDIKLKTGEVVEFCYPNSYFWNEMYGKHRIFHDNDVSEIKISNHKPWEKTDEQKNVKEKKKRKRSM